MCINYCTAVNELGIVLLSIGILLVVCALYYRKTSGKKLKERKNVLIILAAVSLFAMVLGLFLTFSGTGCDVNQMVSCKFFRYCILDCV